MQRKVIIQKLDMGRKYYKTTQMIYDRLKNSLKNIIFEDVEKIYQLSQMDFDIINIFQSLMDNESRKFDSQYEQKIYDLFLNLINKFTNNIVTPSRKEIVFSYLNIKHMNDIVFKYDNYFEGLLLSTFDNIDTEEIICLPESKFLITTEKDISIIDNNKINTFEYPNIKVFVNKKDLIIIGTHNLKLLSLDDLSLVKDEIFVDDCYEILCAIIFDNHIIIGDNNGNVTIFKNGEPFNLLTIEDDEITHLLVLDNKLIIGSINGKILISDTIGKIEELYSFSDVLVDIIIIDQYNLIFAYNGGKIVLCNSKTKQLDTSIGFLNESIDRIKISNDKQLIIIMSSVNIRIWDIKSKRLIRTINGTIRDMEFLCDNRIVTTFEFVEIWNSIYNIRDIILPISMVDELYVSNNLLLTKDERYIKIWR